MLNIYLPKANLEKMINQEEAIKIAEQRCGPDFKFYRIAHGMIGARNVYQSAAFSWAPDDVWCLLCCNHPRAKGSIASSRAIVIHKDTGKILFDGSADDEG